MDITTQFYNFLAILGENHDKDQGIVQIAGETREPIYVRKLGEGNFISLLGDLGIGHDARYYEIRYLTRNGWTAAISEGRNWKQINEFYEHCVTHIESTLSG